MTEYLAPQERERTAYHEAAHAVAAYRHGHYVWKIVFNPQVIEKKVRLLRDAPAQAWVEHDGDFHGLADYRDTAMRILFAPDGVERRLCRERGWPLWEGDDERWEISDWWQIVFGPSRRKAELGWNSARRQKMAYEWSAAFAADEDNWRAVVAVAEALLAAPVGDDGSVCLEWPKTHEIMFYAKHFPDQRAG
jgi:hypothetical protein